MPPIPADKLTAAAQQAAIQGVQGGALGRHFRSLRPAAPQSEAMTRTRALGDYMRFRSARCRRG